MNKFLRTMAILIIVVLLGAGVFSFGKKVHKNDVSPSEPSIEQNVSLPLPSDWLSYDTSTSTYSVTKGTSTLSGGVIIPETFDDGVNGEASVTSIEYQAFYGCTGLTSITIPASVTSIGRYVFRYCSALTSIVVESGNTVYDSRNNCNAIIETETNTLIEGCNTTIIPSTVTDIHNLAFAGCINLTSITIPSSVTKIGTSIFRDCSILTSIVVEDENTVYDSRNNCNAIIETETNTLILSCGKTIIPSTATSIGDNAFYGCTGLTSITIPASVTSIGKYVFSDCSALTSIVVEDENTVYDSRDNCNAIIETATNTLIAGCQNTIIPSTTTSIGGSAFYGCTGLTSITIPSSITSVGTQVFVNCTALTSVTFEENSQLTAIGNNMFQGCTSLTNITIPANATSIGMRAFSGCSSLTDVIFEENSQLTSIGSLVFENCTSLTSITIPANVTKIESFVFNGCTNLTEITILATTPPTLSNANAIPSNATLYVYGVDTYKSASNWRSLSNEFVELEA